MERARSGLIVSALMLVSCSGEAGNGLSNRSAVDKMPATAALPPAPVPRRILAGGGLAGLDLFPPARLESSATVARLFESAYANGASPSGAFERDGVHYDARPHVAFRVGDRLVLLVNHAVPEDEQFHAATGSTSVFYFNLDGTGPVRSLPQAMQGTSWGGEADTYLVMLNGAPAAISQAGFSGQGYTCESRTITFFGRDGLSALPAFPSSYSDLGANGGTEIALVGAAASADGSGIDLQYEGRDVGDDGTPRPVSLRKSLRLDGRGGEWIQSWPYRC